MSSSLYIKVNFTYVCTNDYVIRYVNITVLVSQISAFTTHAILLNTCELRMHTNLLSVDIDGVALRLTTERDFRALL